MSVTSRQTRLTITNMSQKHKIRKPSTQPDPRYEKIYVEKFINKVMRGGNKATARQLVYEAFTIIDNKREEDATTIFEKALENTAPSLEVRPTRVGGATYQVPYEVNRWRRISLAMRWIIDAARSKRQTDGLEYALAEELMAAADSDGDAVKRKHNMHRMAEANKAFAHFAR